MLALSPTPTFKLDTGLTNINKMKLAFESFSSYTDLELFLKTTIYIDESMSTDMLELSPIPSLDTSLY